MTSAQNYAVRIEITMRDAFECGRFEIGGLVNSDCVKRNPFMAMMVTLAYLCDRGEAESTEIISNFFERFCSYDKLSVDEILNLGENSKESTDGNKYANGEEALKDIIACFEADCYKLRNLK